MLSPAALVTLAEAKAALRIRTTDTQMDTAIEQVIEEASSLVEQLTGRLLIWREQAQEGGTALGSAALANNTVMTLATPAQTAFTLSAEWNTVGVASCSLSIVGKDVNAAAQTETIVLDTLRTKTNGTKVWSQLTSVTVLNTGTTSALLVKLRSLAPYVEKHRADGQKHIYVVNRPILQVVKIEDGDYTAGDTGWSELAATAYFVNVPLGKISRVGKTRAFVDFPEDYYFRYPQRAEMGFGNWAADARVTYFGGWTSAAFVPAALKSWVHYAITGLYRERERKDADLENVGNTAGSQSKVNWREALEKGLAGEKRMTGSGEGRVA